MSLFWIFLKIGFLGFGGGYGMLSLILEESIRLGLTVSQFADLNALDMLIPGPIAINSATYIGWIKGGILGSLVTTLAVSLPSFVFVGLFSRFECFFTDNLFLSNSLVLIKAAAVGLIIAVALTLGKSSLWGEGTFSWLSLGVISGSCFGYYKLKINPIVLTLVAGIVGYLSYFIP